MTTTIPIDHRTQHPKWCVPEQHNDDVAEGRPFAHFRYGGDACVASGRYDLAIEQPPRPDGPGWLTPPRITLHASNVDDELAILKLTTGEARVLAAQLLRLADRLDLA